MKLPKFSLPTEHHEQVALMTWAALCEGVMPALRLLYAIPNGGARHKAVAGKLRAEGVKKGVPDLCLPVARGGYHALYVEMKRIKGGVVSASQSEWKARLEAEGNLVVVCRGADEAITEIQNYLKM